MNGFQISITKSYHSSNWSTDCHSGDKFDFRRKPNINRKNFNFENHKNFRIKRPETYFCPDSDSICVIEIVRFVHCFWTNWKQKNKQLSVTSNPPSFIKKLVSTSQHYININEYLHRNSLMNYLWVLHLT